MPFSSGHIVTNVCPGAILKFGCDFWKNIGHNFVVVFYICILSSEGKYLYEAVCSSGLY